MCMAIPSRVLSIDGLHARVETQGQTRAVSLALLEPGSVAVGDYCWCSWAASPTSGWTKPTRCRRWR